MTLAEGQAILATVTYKPGWSFTLGEGGLSSHVRLPSDSTGAITLGEGETLTIDRLCSFNINNVLDAKCLIDIIHSEVVWLEMHEADEWFKVGGCLRTDPHAKGREKAIEAGLCTNLTVVG